MSKIAIGFHDAEGPGRNANGLGDYFKKLDRAGIPFAQKGVGNNPTDGQIVQQTSSTDGHLTIFRAANFPLDTPNYDLHAVEAARHHWEAHKRLRPPEFNTDLGWLETENEIAKWFEFEVDELPPHPVIDGRRVINLPNGKKALTNAEWLGVYAYEMATLALAEGVKYLAYGFSGGEPEPDFWETPSVQRFLALCAEHPDQLGLSLHEYSFDLEDILAGQDDDGVNYKVGRFEFVHQACDRAGIPRPTIVFTEWGWNYDSAPSWPVALDHLRIALDLYRPYPNILGLLIWQIGGGGREWKDIQNTINSYMVPLASELSGGRLNVEHDTGGAQPAPTPPPAAGSGLLLPPPWTGTFLLHPQKLNGQQRAFINDLLENGLSAGQMAPDTSGRSVGFAGWTHKDAIQMAYTLAIAHGMGDTRLVVVDGHQIGTGLDEVWIQSNVPNLLPFVRFIRSEPDPEPTPPPAAGFDFIRLKVWPLVTTLRRRTQAFGVNPALYRPYGFPGHEGEDYGVPEGTPVVAMAAGRVAHSGPTRFSSEDLSAYGYHIVIDHGNGDYTLYAHLKSQLLPVGTTVVPGQRIGYIGYKETAKENTTGPHLHVSTMSKRAPANGYPMTTYGRYFDPSTVMSTSLPTAGSQPSPTPGGGYKGQPIRGGFVAGVDQPASDWYWHQGAEVFRVSGLSPKFHAKGNSHQFFDEFKNGWFNLVRVIIDPSWNVRDGAAIVREVSSNVGQFYGRGARDFVLFNEPNVENLGVLVSDGVQFGRLFVEVAAGLKAIYPDIRLWLTPMSPSGDGRMSGQAFMDQMMTTDARLYAYGVVMHSYTGIANNIAQAANTIVGQVRDWQARYSLDRPLCVGEFSVNRPVNKAETNEEKVQAAAYKAAVYKLVYEQLARTPGVQAAYSFTATWYGGQPDSLKWGESWDVHHEGWLELGVHNHFK